MRSVCILSEQAWRGKVFKYWILMHRLKIKKETLYRSCCKLWRAALPLSWSRPPWWFWWPHPTFWFSEASASSCIQGYPAQRQKVARTKRGRVRERGREGGRNAGIKGREKETRERESAAQSACWENDQMHPGCVERGENMGQKTLFNGCLSQPAAPFQSQQWEEIWFRIIGHSHAFYLGCLWCISRGETI